MIEEMLEEKCFRIVIAVRFSPVPIKTTRISGRNVFLLLVCDHHEAHTIAEGVMSWPPPSHTPAVATSASNEKAFRKDVTSVLTKTK